MAMTLHFKFAEPLSVLFGGHICNQCNSIILKVHLNIFIWKAQLITTNTFLKLAIYTNKDKEIQNTKEQSTTMLIFIQQVT